MPHISFFGEEVSYGSLIYIFIHSSKTIQDIYKVRHSLESWFQDKKMNVFFQNFQPPEILKIFEKNFSSNFCLKLTREQYYGLKRPETLKKPTFDSVSELFT